MKLTFMTADAKIYSVKLKFKLYGKSAHICYNVANYCNNKELLLEKLRILENKQ